MPKNVVVNVNDGERVFTGRLIGFINDEECRALINLEGAARKVSTEKSIDPVGANALFDLPLYHKRFVVVTDDYSEGNLRELFISPKVESVSYIGARKTLKCRGGNEYTLNPPKEKKECGEKE